MPPITPKDINTFSSDINRIIGDLERVVSDPNLIKDKALISSLLDELGDKLMQDEMLRRFEKFTSEPILRRNGIRLFQITRGPNILRDFADNYRAVTGAGLGTAAAVRVAAANAIRAGSSMVVASVEGFGAACAGASAGVWAAAGGLGLAVGYGVVRTGVGEYIGLETVGNALGASAAYVFSPTSTNGSVFQAVDSAFSFLGLNS